MKIFNNLFKKKKFFTEDEILERNKLVKKMFKSALEMYNSHACQCAYPRFQQIIGIDMCSTRHSFKCFDTELLIDASKIYFDIEKSKFSDENMNEKWICKICGSTYEYGWSDFSIHVERQKLKLTELKVVEIGKPALKPIPIYLGLRGHSYPSQTEMIGVHFEEFEKYMMDK